MRISPRQICMFVTWQPNPILLLLTVCVVSPMVHLLHVIGRGVWKEGTRQPRTGKWKTFSYLSVGPDFQCWHKSEETPGDGSRLGREEVDLSMHGCYRDMPSPPSKSLWHSSPPAQSAHNSPQSSRPLSHWQCGGHRMFSKPGLITDGLA